MHLLGGFDMSSENDVSKKMSEEDILSELSESRQQYENGEYQRFDDAIEELKGKYNL